MAGTCLPPQLHKQGTSGTNAWGSRQGNGANEASNQASVLKMIVLLPGQIKPDSKIQKIGCYIRLISEPGSRSGEGMERCVPHKGVPP